MDGEIWQNMFQLGIPVAEKIIRPILVYLFLVITLRLAGKRELAQLNSLDFVVLFTLSNTVQNALIGEDTTVLGGLIGATTLILINYAMVRFLFSHRKLDQLLSGKPESLILNGKINQKALKKELITETELKAAARRQGFASLSEVESAILEPGGAISFTHQKPHPNIERHDALMQKMNELQSELASLKSLVSNGKGNS